MTDRRVFESLCMEPGTPGFSYDTELLVDVDKAINFEDAVIRLTTKCNSILTQLSVLGSNVVEFSVTAARVDSAEESRPQMTGGGRGNKRSFVDPRQPSTVSTPEGRSLRVMEEQWCSLKRKKYSGMVAVARLARSSIPRNGSGGRYSVEVLTQALLYHIESHFMFQSYSPNLKRLPLPSDSRKDTGNGEEYLVYLIYRVQPNKTLGMEADVTCSTKKSRRIIELEDAWLVKS